MKRIFTLASAALLWTGVSAQQQEVQQISNSKHKLAPPTKIHQTKAQGGGSPSIAAPGDTLFYESFANGLAGDGANGTWTLNGIPNQALWEYRGTASNPDVTVGSRGAFAGTQQNPLGDPIASPTATNGFMIFDSDFLDNAGNATNPGGGVAPAPHIGYLVSPTVDFTAVSSAVMTVHSSFRRFFGEGNVEVSIDGGSSWIDTIQLYNADNLEVNESTSDDDIRTFYLPGAIAGEANVKFRFTFDGNPGNLNGNGYYYWMVDDITISESPYNDLRLENGYFSTAPINNNEKYFNEVPVQHAALDTLRFSGGVTNYGSAPQGNTVFTATIDGPTSGSITSTPATVNPGSTDTLVANSFIIPNGGVGDYAITYSVSSDSTDAIPSDNLDSTTYHVTENLYSFYPRGLDATFSNWWNEPYRVVVGFPIYTADTAVAIGIEWGLGTKPGHVVSFQIYDDIDNPNVIGERAFYALTDEDLDGEIKYYNLPITPLPNAQFYFVGIESFQASPDTTSVSTNGSFNVSDDIENGSFNTFVSVNGGNFGATRLHPKFHLLTYNSSLCSNNANIVATVDDDQEVGTVQLDSIQNMEGPFFYNWTGPNGFTSDLADITVTTQGSYSLAVQDINGCSYTQSFTVAGQVTSVEENELEKAVSVYPNPSTDFINVSFESVNSGVYHLSLKNIMGQVVSQSTLNISGNHLQVIDASEVTPGIYFVEITNEGNKSVTRVVKQ